MKIIIYSADWCCHCTDLKNFLRENDIEFEEKDANEYKQEAIARGFKGGMPFTVIGDQTIKGFNKETFKQILKL